jgi:hypothetical protein
MNKFSYLILYIVHAHNVGVSWLRSYARLRLEDATLIVCATPVVCPTPIGRHDTSRMPDSDHMRNSGHMLNSGQKTRLRSYAWLWPEDPTLVICATLIICATSVICPTLIGRRDSRRMPDSGWKIWLQSYIPTLVTPPQSGQHHDSGRASQLWSKSVPHVLPTHLGKTTHSRARWL